MRQGTWLIRRAASAWWIRNRSPPTCPARKPPAPVNVGVILEGNEGNNTCSDTVNVQGPDLTVTKKNDTSSGSVDLGSSFNWTLTVSNSGTDATFPVNGYVLIDDLPAGPTYGVPLVTNGVPGYTGGPVSCAIGAPLASNALWCVASGSPVVLADGASFKVVFSVTPADTTTLDNPRAQGICMVDPAQPTTSTPSPLNGVTNLGLIVETNEGNNTCSDTVLVTAPAAPDLTILKIETSPGPYEEGDSITYDILVKNLGNVTLHNVDVTDPTRDAGDVHAADTGDGLCAGRYHHVSGQPHGDAGGDRQRQLHEHGAGNRR